MKEKTIVAKVFVINPNGLILTLRRSKSDQIRPLEWDLPGGGVDYGEDPTDAVIREAKEEAGLKIQDPKVFVTKTSNDKKYVVRLLYYVHVEDVETITLSFEHNEYKWVSEERFSQLNIPSYYKDCLLYLSNLVAIASQ